MVLKKPYGLMIKHFKLIHVLLLGFAAYVLWQVRPLVSFFNDYVAGGYTTTVVSNMAGNYINNVIYVFLLIIIALLVMLVVLLRYKKKPTNIYLIALIYYIVLLIGIIIAAGLLNSLEEALWNTTTARIYRDVSLMISLPQYIFLPFWLIRALGFNIKHFNFKGDLAELDLSQADSEEVEISLGFETYKAKRIFHRFIREFKYYYSENKFVMIIIIVISSIFLIYLFASNFKSYVVKYDIGKTFTFSNLNIKVEDSIITNLNYGGDDIGSYYLLLKLNVENKNAKETELEFNKFLIHSETNYYTPIISDSAYFIDYGEKFIGSTFKSGANNTIILPYKIENTNLSSEFYLDIYTGVSTKKKEKKVQTIRVDLSPVVVDSISTVASNNLNEEINFNNTYLNNTTLKIKSSLITDKYIYDYKTCERNDCPTFKGIVTPVTSNESQTLIVLDYDFNLDMSTPYSKSSNNMNFFANNFFKIRYTLNGEIKTATVKAITPDKLKNGLIIQTVNAIKEASKVDLMITIRNKQYVVNLVTK